MTRYLIIFWVFSYPGRIAIGQTPRLFLGQLLSPAFRKTNLFVTQKSWAESGHKQSLGGVKSRSKRARSICHDLLFQQGACIHMSSVYSLLSVQASRRARKDFHTCLHHFTGVSCYQITECLAMIAKIISIHLAQLALLTTICICDPNLTLISAEKYRSLPNLERICTLFTSSLQQHLQMIITVIAKIMKGYCCSLY